MICLLVFTDGRDELLAESLASAGRMLTGPITRRVIHDDTGSAEHQAELAERHPGFEIIGGSERRGFGGAIEAAWRHMRDGDEEWVVHVEDDFTYNRPVDLLRMVNVMELRPHLAQLALRRQPWNAAEKVAGGVIEQHPEDYEDFADGGNRWLEHRRFFSTNPCLYRASLTWEGWPNVERSEGMFSAALFANPEVRCGFWGSRESGEWVHHIGAKRAGTGY